MADNIRDRLFEGSKGLTQHALAPMTMALDGGQNGVMTNIGKHLQNASYVKRNSIIKVVTFPTWIESMDDPEQYRRAIKTFWEVQAKVEGLNKALTAEFAEQEIGRTGKRQYDVSRVLEAQSDINTSMIDKYGQPYKELFSHWLRYGMMDPDSGVPLISILDESITDLLPDVYCVTILVFEPDPLHRFVQNAWLLTNMAPRGNGNDDGRKDLTASGDVSEMSFGWTSLQQTGYGVKKFAQAELDKLNRNGLNPITREAFVTSIDADVESTAGGYYEQADDIADQQVK